MCGLEWRDEYIDVYLIREGCGAMVRAWSFAYVAAAVRFQTPLGAGFFKDIACFSPLSIGTLFRY